MNLAKKNSDLKKEKSNVSKELFDELLNPSLDLSIDYSEIYIDDIIENETLKEIPIIKSVVGVIKGGISINNFWFAKKLLTFIRDFNNGTANLEKVELFKRKLSESPKFGKKIAERLMIFIDKNIEITQTKIITNLFTAFVNQDITYEEFNGILITLDKLNPKAFDWFFELEKTNFDINEKNYNGNKDRDWEMESFITNSGFGQETSSWFHGFKMNNDGLKLFEFGIKPLKNN